MAKNTKKATSANEDIPAAPRELIVVANPGDAIRAQRGGSNVASAVEADVSSIAKILNKTGARMRPLFDDTEERVIQAQATAMAESSSKASDESVFLPDLSLYYAVDAADEDLDDLASQFTKSANVQAAYIKPPTYFAQTELQEESLDFEGAVPLDFNAMTALEGDAPPVTPDFTARQGYLDPAPGGVDARFAWTQPGGRGRNVRVIDIEGAWNFDHEDMRQNQGGVLGTPTNDLGWRNHGTAVCGVIGGDVNRIGITGISPEAHCRGISIFGNKGSARAIREAADLSRPGDIILIELHRPGPNANGSGQFGFIALEWWPDDYAAIRYASNKGVIVVEAAGNGSQNLEDAVYDRRPANFPSDWSNPFRRGKRDSGAVLVGAGAPPEGTHGRNHGPDRSRLGFSNYGALIDAQGWGREVTTTAYGDLQGGNENLWYTDRFSGTSSASPIVVGALACVQGTLRAKGRIPLTPARARNLLRRTGSPQQDAQGRPRTQRIGRRPNLRQLIPLAHRNHERIGVQFTGRIPANQTRRWFTHSWPAHWHVLWSVVPTNPRRGGPQVRWDVAVERSTDAHVTYFITITNLSDEEACIEGRYAILGY